MINLDRGYLNYIRDDESELCMLHCGIKQIESGELCGPAIRRVYLLHYVVQGKGKYFVNNKEYNLAPGDVFAIYPDDMVSYKADEEEPWLLCWMEFGGKNPEFYYDRIGIQYENPVMHLNNRLFERGVANCLDYIEANENNLSQLRLTGFAYEVLSAFETKEESDGNKSEELYISKSIRYIDHNIHEKILVSDVVRYVGLEHSYFYRVFKKNVGMSPEKYIIERRIEMAKKYIQAGVDIKNIPSLVGISDIYYFYKCFKKVTGMTPSQHKNST